MPPDKDAQKAKDVDETLSAKSEHSDRNDAHRNRDESNQKHDEKAFNEEEAVMDGW